MANEKILDMTKSAADNETAVNQKFNELEQQGGGISLDDLKAEVTQGEYGTSLVIGDNVELPTTPARLIEAVNTIRMIKDMKDTVLNVSGEYGHEPQMLIHNGKAYIVYSYHEIGDGEQWNVLESYKDENQVTKTRVIDYKRRTKIRLSIIDLSTNPWSIVRKIAFDVAGTYQDNNVSVTKDGTGFVRDGITYTIMSAGSPNLVLLNSNTIRIVCDCEVRSDFNPEDNTFGSNHQEYDTYIAGYETYLRGKYAAEDAAYKEAHLGTPMPLADLMAMETSGGVAVDGMAYRDYFINDDDFGNAGTCTITKESTTKPMRLATFKELIENAGSTLQLHSQYAKVNNKYYISLGNGTSGKNGNIFTTEDFINYTWFAKPEIPAIGENLGLEYEIAVCPWFDAWNYVSLYLAIRRSRDNGNLIVAKMHTGLKYVNNQFVEGDKAAGSIDGYKIIPCNSSRPCFFCTAGSIDFMDTKGQFNLFLAYDNKAQTYPYRDYTDVCFFTKNTFADSTVRRISQCLTMTYPSIVYNDGFYYVAYQGYTTGNQPHILLSKFRPFSANWDKVIAGLSKMLDTFEPSES